MKSHSLVNSLLLTVLIGAGSLEVSKGIINTFSFDIFRKCVTGEYGVSDPICQYGPQLSINLLGAIIFAFAAFFVFRQVDGVIKSKLGFAVLALLMFLLLSAAWRIQISLQNNFQIVGGPSTFLEYLYVGFVWLDTIIVGLLLGFAAWFPIGVDRSAKARKEPKVTFNQLTK